MGRVEGRVAKSVFPVSKRPAGGWSPWESLQVMSLLDGRAASIDHGLVSLNHLVLILQT